MTAAIRLCEVGKRYEIGRALDPHRTLREALVDGATRAARGADRLLRPGRRRTTAADEFWALRDVSFEIARGEAVGVVGGNGAGKSTLLKLLSRITAPTTGRIELRGRVGSLLEVGTGFHPDLSGRDNVFLNGAILGMRRSEVARKFDEIVAFAEVERFIDTPVKRYSSGMYLRLAFAVAAHLEPDVLLVDEVLAVGDAAFQRKCLGKMGDVAAEGRTVLFVSHNMAAVESLCGRAIWMRDGIVMADGRAGAVVSRYLGSTFRETVERRWTDQSTSPGTGALRLRRIAVRAGPAGDGALTVRTPMMIEIDYWNGDPEACIWASVNLYNDHQVHVFDNCPAPDAAGMDMPAPAGLLRTTCAIPGDLLNDGRYRAVVTLVRNGVALSSDEASIGFVVQDSVDHRDGWFGEWPGVIRPQLSWELNVPLETTP